MILTYRYRILPTKRQHRALEEILEAQRQLYNAALEERIDAYRKAHVSRTYFDQAKALTEWRHTDPEAARMPVNVQRATLKRLDVAYKSFIRRASEGEKPGLPRFRGKGRFNSFGFAEFCGISLNKSRLRFRGMPGSLQIHFHRLLPDEGKICGCVFRRDSKGWHVGFTIKCPETVRRKGGRAIGLDLGIRTFAALSDGGTIPSLRAARKAHRRMRVKQRSLARKQQGSAGRTKSRREVARCHALIRRQRLDFLHQASAHLVRKYDIVAVEALNIRGLANGFLAGDVRDASWATFISMLRYKAEKAGARLIEVDPRNTSQECSRCGILVPKTLDELYHRCPNCGLSIDRDLNAARNVLNRAGVGPSLPNVTGSGMRAGGILG